METPPRPDNGVLELITPEALHSAPREFDPLYYVRDEPEPPPSTANWKKVKAFIRNDSFVLQSSTPTEHIEISFSPEKPEDGWYTISRKPNGRVEKGTTFKVQAVPVEAKAQLLRALSKFDIRYQVLTVSADRPHRKLLWLIGLTDCQSEDAE